MSNNGDALTCSISMSMCLLPSDITNDLEGLTGFMAAPSNPFFCLPEQTYYRVSASVAAVW